ADQRVEQREDVGGHVSSPVYGGCWRPSVFSRTTVEVMSMPSSWRRISLPGPVWAARTPARVAAPLGPELTPSRARSVTARAAASSVTATAASHPASSTGHAAPDGVPQLRPAMFVTPVSMLVSAPE